jgi:protein-L-isoaspartate(D-aspartate) O-methyltransferase
MNQLQEQSPLERMIQQQVVDRGIRDERILSALRAVPRERFFPEPGRNEAFADRAAPIGHGQTISQPYMVALMTHRLRVLCRLAKDVYSVERVKPLLDEAFERLMGLNLRNVHFRYGDGTLGWPEAAPFDRILIGAGAPRVPEALLLGHLTDGGIAVLPVGPSDEQMLLEVRRDGSRLEQKD